MTAWVQFLPVPTHETCLCCSAMSCLMKLACLTGLYPTKHLWVCSKPRFHEGSMVNQTYPDSHGIYLVCLAYTRYIPCLSEYVTGMEQTHKCFQLWGIIQSYELNGHMTGITLGYFKYTPHIYLFDLVYASFIPDIFFFESRYILGIYP